MNMNTVWLVQGLDETDGNTEWETILVSDTWAGLIGRFNGLPHRSNWQSFRIRTTQVYR